MGKTVRGHLVPVAQALLAAVLAAALAVPAASQPSPPGAAGVGVPGSWVVLLKDGTDPTAVAAALGVEPDHTYVSVFRGFAARLAPEQLGALTTDRRVLSVTADRIIRRVTPTLPGPGQFRPAGRAGARGCPSTAPLPEGHPAQFVSSGLERIGGPAARTAAIDCHPDGMDADIAVVDTGVFDHIDLNLAGGADCHAGEGFDDADGHGTLIAGFAAAEDNAFGAVGVAPGARIWAVRVEDPDGNISLANELCGLDWIHGHGGIDVANLSFGDTGFDKGNCGLASVPLIDLRTVGLDLSIGRTRLDVIDPEHFAICRVHQAGTTVVVSAGNDNADTTLVTPAAYPEVVTVSAYSDLDGHPGGLGPEPCRSEPQEEDDALATFSNFGRPVDLAAPGVCITSTVPPLAPGSPATGSYETVTGSSFSTPLVAGAAALLKARHPEWSPEHVRDELLRAAEPGPIRGDPDEYAEGLLDVRSF